VAYPASKKKAKAAVAASRAMYEEWKKTHCLEVYTITGAIVIESGMSLGNTATVALKLSLARCYRWRAASTPSK
jgi:hypothetical protein